MRDDAVCMAILFSSLINTDGRWESYAAGGPREELANNSAKCVSPKSGAGVSHTTSKTGVTVAVTILCRKGSGPTWHSRQQWSGTWCDSSWEANARDWPSNVRHTSKRTGSVLPES
jgi:hypothetical protein